MSSTIGSARAVTLLVALMFLNILSFIDRYLLISFSTSIIPDLGLSHLQFGLLTGLAFTGIYTVVGLISGALADKIDRTYVIGVGVLIWSGLTAATGFARNFGQMAVARLFVGVGEACLTPAAVSMLADAFSPGRRALVSGIYYIGVPVGIGGSFLLAAAVGPALGWRGTFMALGVIGMVASLLVFGLMVDPPRAHVAASVKRHKPTEKITQARREELRQWVKEALRDSAATDERRYLHWLLESLHAMTRELRGNPAFRLTLVGGVLLGFMFSSNVLDLLWWVQERGHEVTIAQKMIGGLFMVGGVLGVLIGGAGADWAYRRLSAGRLKFLGWCTLVAVSSLVAYRLVPSHTILFYTLAFATPLMSMLVFGPLFSVVQELVPPDRRATAVAVLLLSSALVGTGAGNATVGWLSDVLAAQGAGEPITYAMLIMAAAGLLAAPAFFAAARHQCSRPPAADAERTYDQKSLAQG